MEMLERLNELAKKQYVSSYFLAGIHVGIGENDQALAYLERAYEEKSHWLIYLHIDPGMDTLRGEPRFKEVLGRIGLPP